MIAIVYAIAVVLLLTACTSVVPVSKPGSTEADWLQADYVCLRDASVAATPRRDRRLYEACLRAKGWTIGESGSGLARRSYEYKP
jgi:hypothetical protein